MGQRHMVGTCGCDCHDGDGSEAACGEIHSTLLQGCRRQFQLAACSHLITSRICTQSQRGAGSLSSALRTFR
jgi:hypothetical protein